MSPRKEPQGDIVYGGIPRVDLLPPEVKLGRRGEAVRRRLVIGVVGVVVIAAAGYGASTFQAAAAQRALDDARAQTLQLLAQQTEFRPGRQVKEKIGLVESARQFGVSSEIDWQSYLALVEKSLPASATITAFVADGQSPFDASSAPSADPLTASYAATITFTAESDALPDIEDWMKSLADLPGFADANPDSVTRAKDEPYVATITMHVTTKAYSGRYQPKSTETPTPAPTSATTAGGEG